MACLTFFVVLVGISLCTYLFEVHNKPQIVQSQIWIYVCICVTCRRFLLWKICLLVFHYLTLGKTGVSAVLV